MKNSPKSFVEFITSTQRVIFLISLLLIPVVVLPIPWGWSDYVKGLFMVLFFVLYLTLEFVKVVNKGVVSMFKGSLDLAVLLILASLLLSTIFSQDINTSLWGFDKRLATGSIVIISSLIYFVAGRTVINSRSAITKSIYALITGISLSAFLALMSYRGINIFGFSSSLSDLFIPGVTTFASSDIAVMVWGTGVLLSIFALVWNREDTELKASLFPFISAIISLAAIIIFSIGVSVSLLVILLTSVTIVLILVFGNRKEGLNNASLYSVILFGILFVGVVVMRLEPAQKAVLNSGTISSQIKLESEHAWNVVSSSLTNSISRGLLGVGVDTYSIYYNLNRPAVSNDVDLSQTNLSYSNSELLNIVGNRGVVGALLWLGVGIVLINLLLKDIKEYKSKKESSSLLNLFAILMALYIYLASYVVYLGFEGYFIFSFLIGFGVSVRSILAPASAESFVMKLDMLVEGSANKKNITPLALTVLSLVVGSILIYMMIGPVNALKFALSAESQIVDIQKKIEENPDIGRQETILSISEVINKYGEAVNQDPSNYVYRRRAALVMMDYTDNMIVELSEQIEGQEDKDNDGEIDLTEEQQAIRNQISSAIQTAIDQGDRATEENPNIFANWNTRGFVYSRAVGYGYVVYVDPGIESILNNAIPLNPLDNIQYFRLAQLYVAKEELNNAVVAINSGLQVNPNHIPTLLLASELAVSVDQFEDALNLLDRTKLILEALELKESELYTYVTDRISKIKEAAESGEKEIEDNLDSDIIDEDNSVDSKLEQSDGDNQNLGIGDDETLE